MQDLFAKIDAEPARTPRHLVQRRRLVHRFRDRASRPRTLGLCGRWPLRSPSCCRRAFSPDFVMQDSQGGPTLASHRHCSRPAPAPSSLIRFNPQASVADISKFLADHNASIVGGPAAGSGLFRAARSPTSRCRQAELGAIVKRMQGNPVVGFTVPAAAVTPRRRKNGALSLIDSRPAAAAWRLAMRLHRRAHLARGLSRCDGRRSARHRSHRRR